MADDTKKQKTSSKFIFLPTPLWHAAVLPLPVYDGHAPPLAPVQLSTLSQKAASLHETDVQTFQNSSSSSTSESGFLTKIIQSGTLSDRLSALTLLVQSSPVHSIKALETLRGMAERGKGKGGREESLKALRCIVDWWIGGGAPERKLKYFRDQPLSHPSVTDQYLLLWYFEDWLKKYFFSILQILETLSLDPLPYIRTQSLQLIFMLLRDKPEQEQNLLRLLVNKLGDTNRSLCSRASYHLLQLLQVHPSMKAVVTREITALVMRPASQATVTPANPPQPNKHIRFADDDVHAHNREAHGAGPSYSKAGAKAKTTAEPKKKTGGGNAHATYYAMITLNQLVLTPADRDVALKLIEVYFEMFKEILGEGDVEAREEDAENGNMKEKKVVKDKKGRVVDGGKGKKKKGKEKEKERDSGGAGFAEVEDQNTKLVSAILTGVNRALPFAKVDAGDVGISKHIDTLFLITHTSTFNASLQALVLIQHICSSFVASKSQSQSALAKSITDRYYRTFYASLHDVRLATSSKQAMYLNLLFKSLKADVGGVKKNERVKAVVRRFVQVLVSGGSSGATEFVAGGLYLLGELFSTVPGLRELINDPPSREDQENYDPRKRDPQYAHASASPLWELTPLLHHYHPTISLHARQLLLSQPLSASADLTQNTLTHFLDRFVYKNPKQQREGEGGETKGKVKVKGGSVMQPAASGFEGGGVKLRKGGGDGVMVNEAGFLRKKEEDVPVDQMFYYKYFMRKNEKEKAIAKARAEVAKKKGHGDGESDAEGNREDAERSDVSDHDKDDDDEDDEDDDDDDDEDEDEDEELDEDEVWKAMKASMPKAAGDDDILDSEGSDDTPSEFDMDSDADEDEDEDEKMAREDGDDEEEEEGVSLIEGSDNEDLIPLDDDIPEGLIGWDGGESKEEEEGEEEWHGLGATKKRKGEHDKETRTGKRKKLRSLPTFASYEEYAKMIEDGPEDDI